MAKKAMAVFQLERGRAALEKYAAVNHLTVQVYDADGQLVAGGVHRTALHDLLSREHDPGLFERCARQCLAGPLTGVVVEENYGIAVFGTPLVLGTEILGAVVAGYAPTMHLTYREVERLARGCRLNANDVGRSRARSCPSPARDCPCAGSCCASSPKPC
jgi:hypothetical protein